MGKVETKQWKVKGRKTGTCICSFQKLLNQSAFSNFCGSANVKDPGPTKKLELWTKRKRFGPKIIGPNFGPLIFCKPMGLKCLESVAVVGDVKSWVESDWYDMNPKKQRSIRFSPINM